LVLHAVLLSPVCRGSFRGANPTLEIMGETIMTNLRKALLGGAALAVMATGAQADELSTLKAQLEALQARVDTMQSAPAALPEGTSLMTFRRGSGDYGDMQTAAYKDRTDYGYDNQGFTIGIAPTADMPAPVAEITVGGYVRSWVIYGIDGHNNTGAGGFDPYSWRDTGDDHINLNSRGSISVKSKIDTAIGQIRTAIEIRAEAPDRDAEMRYAWGEWDMTPNWTFGAGSFFQTTSMINVPTTVNSSGPLGVVNVTRYAQVRLTYTDGPLSWAVALEDPTDLSNTNMPNIATSLSYDVAGGHSFQLVAAVGDLSGYERIFDDEWEGPNDDLGWMAGGSVGFNLADVATMTFAGSYSVGGSGISHQYINGYNCPLGIDDNGDLCASWGITAGLGFGVTEVSSFNVFFGYEKDDSSWDSEVVNFGRAESAWNVGANIIWQPVKQMKMGWEVNYGEVNSYGCNDERTNGACEEAGDRGLFDNSALAVYWGTWFYF